MTTFFVMNRPDLEASCIHKFYMSTCFSLPSPLRLTKHIVAEASKCRFFSPHDIPKSFATLWIPSPPDAALTAAYSSLSAEDSDTTCCFLVHTLTTPADTDCRVALSPPSQHPNTHPARHSGANALIVMSSP